MTSGKKSLILGILIGIVLSFFYFKYFAPRYEIENTDTSTIRIDKWTGQSWRLVEDNWKEMVNMDEDYWISIDKTLWDAININNIPEAQVDSTRALKNLRERYPVLKDIPDYDLLERIKFVYSKKLLVKLYLGDYMKTDDKGIVKEEKTETP